MTEPSVFEWTPPANMAKSVASGWRTFYRHVFTTYGLTPEAYRAIYLAQLGRCYICRTAKGIHPDDPNGGGWRRLGVDHNHAIGYGKPEAVRGLLCSGGDKTCNRIIGWLSPEALIRAASYVRTMPAQNVLALLEDVRASGHVLNGRERDTVVHGMMVSHDDR